MLARPETRRCIECGLPYGAIGFWCHYGDIENGPAYWSDRGVLCSPICSLSHFHRRKAEGSLPVAPAPDPFILDPDPRSRSSPYRATPGTPLDIDVNGASMSAGELRAEWPFGELADKTVYTVATVPVPISRRSALEGGDAELQYAKVEDGDTLTAEALPAGPQFAEGRAAQPDSAQPAIQLAELTVESGEAVPLPISRSVALDGGDVTLKFAALETVVTTATMNVRFPSKFPAAGRGLPFQVLLGEQPETSVPVELASYNQAIEKARHLNLRSAAGRPEAQPGTISAAALDNPGPIVSASQFTRADLPVFLLKKIDGTDETP